MGIWFNVKGKNQESNDELLEHEIIVCGYDLSVFIYTDKVNLPLVCELTSLIN